jgi:flagellar hook protein FlgE
MASDISTIQSLKAVDAWIDVINANINGGVRTAYKASRLKFGGSNTDVARSGNATSLPLQFPEPALTTSNTVVDWTQGAITASTEASHLAIQGEGFFLLASPELIDTTPGANFGTTRAAGFTTGKFLVTRDGEFRTDQNGFLVNAAGYYLVTSSVSTGLAAGTFLFYNGAGFTATTSGIRAVFNDTVATASTTARYVTLSSFTQNDPPVDASGASLQGGLNVTSSLLKIGLGKDMLQMTSQGSTVFDFGYKPLANFFGTAINHNTQLDIGTVSSSEASILTKSLEASNASMTQSVPELSLAQKLFSALTKVLQTKQTNVDGVLNLVR